MSTEDFKESGIKGHGRQSKSTESVNRALREMRLNVHTGLNRTPFEIHHGMKPRTELKNTIKDGKTYLSYFSAPISFQLQ